MNDRAAELDQLADDLEALLQYEDPFDSEGDGRPGPALLNNDTEHAGFAAVAEYARARAEWLRGQA